MNLNFKYNIFGSKSSQDIDVMISVDSVDDVNKCKDLVKYYTSILEVVYPNTKIDINLAVIENGIITKVYKGEETEYNNALYLTYELHEQLCDRIVKNVIIRDVELKILRGIRNILQYYSRTNNRVQVKEALHGNLIDMINVISNIKFSNIDFSNKVPKEDIWKIISFQIAQMLFLAKYGIEVYTKEDICSRLPLLSNFVERKTLTSNDFEALNNYYKELEQIIINKYTKIHNLNERSIKGH